MAQLLEQEIEELQSLDAHRARCRELREEAAQALVDLNNEVMSKAASGVWAHDDWDSAKDDVERAMILRALNTISRGGVLKLGRGERDKITSTAATLREHLRQTQIDSLFLKRGERDQRHDTDKDVDQIPMFRACHIIGALVEDDDKDSGPFCQATMSCVYGLMTELYRVEEPDWRVGGVRASVEAPQSAFITREAVRSVLLFHAALANTAHLLDELASAAKAWDDSKDAPPSWRHQSSTLRHASFTTSAQARWPHVLPDLLPRQEPTVAVPEPGWAVGTSVNARDRVAQQWDAFGALLQGLSKKTKLSKKTRERVTDAVHDRVTSILEDIHKAVEVHFETNSREDLGEWSAALKTASALVLRILDPARVYLEAVLVAELPAEANGAGTASDAAQANIAAAALAGIDGAADTFDRDDLRLAAAARLSSSRLTERGALPSQTPFDVAGKGYRLLPQSAEIIRAICDVLRVSSVDCDTETARRLVRYFLESRAKSPAAQPGWHSDAEPRKANSEIWATALTFFALGDLQSMLDQQINDRVTRRFTVRDPDELNLTLDDLFLPDGVSAVTGRPSIGEQLQKMREHVEGASSFENSFSVVLYGPPGTGKSTLMEAVAKSARARLVEITPSDILLGGSEQMERHTGMVFSALSMLTRTVVLFDEFDSILRTRSLDRDRPVSEFSFLTPGLLPKLKRLHDKAAKQQVAFALATNFVGDLDSAAIRSGRFDAKLGIFPPDFLARVGRLATEMRRHKSNPPADEHRWDRAIAIIDACAGYGMATLGKPGWFTKPGKNKSYSGMPFGHIFDSETSPALGEKESERPEYPPPAGTADVGFQEWREWAVIADLDSRGKAIEPEKGAKDRWRSYLGKIEGVWVARAQELHDTEKNDANAWKARAARATEPPQGR